MKINYLCNASLEKLTADAIHVMHMCDSFVNNGCRIQLFARIKKRKVTDQLFADYGIKKNFSISSFETVRVRLIGAAIYGFIQGLRASINGADVCYARCPVSAFFALLFGSKLIFEVHEMPDNLWLKAVYHVILKHKNLIRLVAISEALLVDIASAFSLSVDKDSNKCIVAHDAANIGNAGGCFLLKSGPGCQIGYAGGLRKGNGIGMILKLAEAFPGHTFHIVGGDTAEVNFWNKKNEFANIVWYGRHLPANIPAFLGSCDILLAPYQHGPKTNAGKDTSKWMSPLKVFEYLASGKPAIISDFKVLREIINNGNAVLATPDSFTSWSEALKDLVVDESLRKKIGRCGQSLVFEHFTWLKRASKVISGLNLMRDQPNIGILK